MDAPASDLLRLPVLFPNWVPLLGGLLLIVALTWGISLWFAHRHMREKERVVIHSLSETRRLRYRRLLQQVEAELAAGEIDARAAHLSVAAIIRSAASERLKVNVESATVADARHYFGHWPSLVTALEWVEEPSFGTSGQANQSVARGIGQAKVVIEQ